MMTEILEKMTAGFSRRKFILSTIKWKISITTNLNIQLWNQNLYGQTMPPQI